MLLLRFDPAVHDALARWAADELRSTTAQIELLLRRALSDAGRLPRDVRAMPKRGRPRKEHKAMAEDELAASEPLLSKGVEKLR